MNASTTSSKATNFQFNNSDHANTTINIQNIQLRDFGDENPKWFNASFLDSLMYNIQKAIPRMMKEKHFNDDFPENQNIRIHKERDMKKRLQVFKNGRWNIKDGQKVFYDVIIQLYEIISDALSPEIYLEGEKGEINREVLKAMRQERFQEKISRIRPIWEEFEEKMKIQDTKTIESLWDDLKTLLLDKQLELEQEQSPD
jgi:hypothetical protein